MITNLKAWLALHVAKAMMWLIRLGIGWVKSVTPDYAMRARRASKQKILQQKAKALETPGLADDIAPLGAFSYMGFATMAEAQRKLMECFELTSPAAGNEPAGSVVDEILNRVRETIRILDEPEPQ